MSKKKQYVVILTVDYAIPSETPLKKYYNEDQEVTIYVAKTLDKANEQIHKLLRKYERKLKLQGAPLYESFTEYDHFKLSIGEPYHPEEAYIKLVNVKIFEAKTIK